ncbi:MAG TPA: Zn-dependent hydrolase [candidate division Zixibacteria bacterium]|nr:Zn-dependent hydrolase [candidate division Zixibacteria bacterium]
MRDDSYQTLRVNGDRLWRRLMEMARIGATPKGGVCRLTLSDEDKVGRDLFVRWCEEAGCSVGVDQIGNIFARRSALESEEDEESSSVLVGSHLDSVPTGGKFDGPLGVLAGLEVVETLNDHNIVTLTPVEIVSWTNEEGSRFVPALVGSGVFAGAFDLDYALSVKDKSGLSFGAELERISYSGAEKIGSRSFKATFEMHIEQGPILEQEGKTIGIVTAVQGMRWYEVVLVGKEAHAGPTPMNYRKDPVKGLQFILQEIFALADRHAPHGRATFGDIKTEPGVTNTVPGRLIMKVDLRHPEADALEAMDQALRKIVQEACKAAGLSGQVYDIWQLPPVRFDPGCIESVRSAAEMLDTPAMEMVSGAGHDAAYIARVAPTSMVFIPCEDGLSHNELENAAKSDVIAGANVLLHAVLSQVA